MSGARERNFAKNSIIISIGTIAPKLTAFITLPILTACLTKTEYGTYDLINTIISLILPIATLKIEMAVFRFLLDYKKNLDMTKTIVSTAVFFDLIIAIIIMIVYWIASSKIPYFTRVLIATYFILDSLMAVIMQIVRGFSKNLIYSICAIVNAVVSMLIIVVAVGKLNWGLNGVLIACSLSIISSIIIVLWRMNISQYFSYKAISIDTLKNMLSYSWPLVPNSLSLWVMNLSDRFIITGFIGIEANAIYAVANKIPQLFSVVQGSVVTAWQENASLASSDSDSDEYYSKVFDDIYCIISGAMALLIAVTPVIFKVFIHGSYEKAYFQMPFLFLGMFFSSISSFLGGLYVAHKRTFNVGITTIISATINVIINILFVKKIGIFAGSISTMISFLFLAIYRMCNVLKFQKIKYNLKRIICYSLILVVICIIFYQNIIVLDVFNMLFSISFAFLINWKILKSFINIIIHRNKKSL